MIKAVYIVSSSFSGSTLLSMFWAAHPDFTSNGELVRKIRYPYPYPCSCYQPIRECPFWLAVGDRMRKFGLNFDPANTNDASFLLHSNPFIS